MEISLKLSERYEQMRIWTYQMLFKARALERVEIRQRDGGLAMRNFNNSRTGENMHPEKKSEKEQPVRLGQRDVGAKKRKHFKR